jgi:oligopeptide/dipeptide ABC transporter ATP-binding protein
MLDMKTKSQAAFVLITHDFSLAWAVGDRIGVMYSGRIVEMGPAFDVIREPRHPYTRALVSVVPVPDPTLQRKRIVLRGEVPDPVDVPVGCRFHPRCPIAKERCKTEDPEIQNVTAEHQVACHFWQEAFP